MQNLHDMGHLGHEPNDVSNNLFRNAAILQGEANQQDRESLAREEVEGGQEVEGCPGGCREGQEGNPRVL